MSLLRAVAASVLWMTSVLSLAAAGGLMYLRATTPTGPRAIELVALTPLTLPLAGLALVGAIAVIALTRRGVRRRVVAWCIAVTALVVTGVAFSWVAPLFLGHKPTAQSGGSLIVMAQNLEYGDPRAVAEKALNTRADVLVITDARASTVMWLRAAEMRRELRYEVGIGPSGPNGSVVFSRYPLTEVARISDGGDSRVLTVHSPKLGDVDLVALHPTPPYQSAAWIADYERITTNLRDRYATTAGIANRPVIIAGDLNATPDHAPFRSMEALGFTDAVDQLNLGFQPTWPAPGSVQRAGLSIPPFVQIDHVLTSPALVATALITYHCGGADHMGVLATVQLARP